MAKKNSNSDNSVLIGLSAFLVGTALAQPSQQNAQKLNEFKSQEHLFYQFQQNYYDFQDYLVNRKLFDEFKNERILKNKRWESLGEMKINQRIRNFPEICDFFNEGVNMFLEGFFRNSCISCAIVMEALLKEKFGNGRLVELIDLAKNEGLISQSDKHYLHGIRVDRNDFVHTIDQKVSENDAQIVILITAKIINKIV